MELTIFQLAGRAPSVIKYVEGGGLEHDLALIETKAAKDAFEKSKIAEDKKSQMSQIWSVINHLETAETALKPLVESQMNRNLKPFPWWVNVSELFNIRIFMASCYIYLEQRKLGLTMLDRAEDCLELLNNGPPAAMFFANLPYIGFRDIIFREPLKLLGVKTWVPMDEKVYGPKDIERKLKPTIRNLRKEAEALPQKSLTKNLFERFK